MLSSLFLLILFILSVEPSFPYPPFNGVNHLSPMETMMDPDVTNRISFQSNDVMGCDMEDILGFVGLEELQELIEAIAVRKGVSPFMVLRKLNRRMRNREELEEALIHSIDGPPLPEMLKQPLLEYPPAIKLSPETSRTPYFLPPNVAMHDRNDEDTKVVIIPVAPSSMNRTPMGMKPEHKPRKEMIPLVGKLSSMLPGVFLSPKSNQIKPPQGATVRVNSGDPLSPLSRDIIVTVSPLMTLIEAVRQAEMKVQSLLGLNHDTDIITFAHSLAFDCYIVNSIDEVAQNDDSGWKVTITDRDGQVVYDSFCLPGGKEVLVKPGTLISLTYVHL